jgi:hypothetical protein
MKYLKSSMPAFATALLSLQLLAACALVPKESVELSTMVGRDIASVRQSHRQLAETLFTRMEKDVNRFVDDVYAPFQIQVLLSRQKESQASGNANNIFSVLDLAMRQPDNAQAQTDILNFMQAFVEIVHEDVEDYRTLRLAPVEEQERAVLADIDAIYDQIERGNATVTAHLASVVKVHEAQDELLTAVDLAGIREKLGLKLSKTSSDIADFVARAEKIEGGIDDASEKIDELTKTLDDLTGGK